MTRAAAAAACGLLLAATGCGASELATADSVLFPEPARNAVTFWGHACCYIDVDGFGIVTDPVFERSLPLRRRKVGAPPPAHYSGARVVVISHAHHDHLSPATLATFPRGTVVLCPEPAAKHVAELGLEVRAMAPGEAVDYPGGRIVAVAAHHMGGRWGLKGRADGRALGWVVETPYGNVYYSGDTNYFRGFAEVGNRYRPDIAILNISGHLHGTDAVFAAFDTRARTVIPTHHGAYGWLFLGERTEPRDAEEMQRLLGPLLVTLDLGESLPLPLAR
ncbi:MAG: MBL fold metallo-hydrolase [Candidatus Krumholzibacteria bacterium]|nr:MBL fold metallo-hydrolase [Candidatus Krumholzibacteria bacterium]